nr:MAG TPA: hypothetical protein [Caudoviricetes sp.]
MQFCQILYMIYFFAYHFVNDALLFRYFLSV